MQITRVEGIRVAVPIEAPILTCYGALQVFTRTVIKVHTTDGVIGIGETHGAVTPQRLEVLGKAIAGIAPWEVGRIRARLNNLNYYSKDEQAIAGIEVACLDLLGRVTGRPVYDLLGGKLRDEIEAAAYMFFRNANDDGAGEIQSAEAMAAPCTPSCQPTAAAASALRTLWRPGRFSVTGIGAPASGRDRSKCMRMPSWRILSARTSASGWVPYPITVRGASAASSAASGSSMHITASP